MLDQVINDEIYWPDFFPEKKDTIFLDIETTGLSPHNSCIYMIGIAAYDGTNWHVLQWFSERLTDELSMLCETCEYISSAKAIVTFNGNTFDIPFINKTLSQYNKEPVVIERYLDLYKLLKAYKAVLGIENVKQSTIENRIGVSRNHDKSGAELIKVYEEYLKNPTEKGKKELFYHNYCDMTGMLELLKVFKLKSILDGGVKLVAKELKDDTLCLLVSYDNYPGFEVECIDGDISLSVKKDIISIRVKANEGKVKLYYNNYKDYYYLPMEDRAIHKTLGDFVDPTHRVKATRDTSYSWESIENIYGENALNTYVRSVVGHILK